jgi:hypothetical protein
MAKVPRHSYGDPPTVMRLGDVHADAPAPLALAGGRRQ